jgi:hypothetical protein
VAASKFSFSKACRRESSTASLQKHFDTPLRSSAATLPPLPKIGTVEMATSRNPPHLGHRTALSSPPPAITICAARTLSFVQCQVMAVTPARAVLRRAASTASMRKGEISAAASTGARGNDDRWLGRIVVASRSSGVSLDGGKILQRLNRHRNHVGISPGRRDSYRT